MRLHRLTLRHVRGVEERCIDFAPDGSTTGVVIVEGCNEAGKSTLGDALDILLECKDSSRNSDVRSLKSADRDEAPEIEADLEVGEHRFVYTKRFLKRPSTELRITSPRRENLSGEEAHARVERMLHEAMDVGLWSSLRLRQGKVADQAGPGGTRGLAAALAGHTDASPIGDAELAILDAVRQEYETYYTPKNGTERPIVKEAAATVAQHEGALADIEARRNELEGQIETAHRLDRALPTLREDVTESEAKADELAAQRREVEALEARVTECERHEATAAEKLDHLRERRDRRQSLIRQLETTATEQERLGGSLVTAEDQQRSATDRLERAQEELDDAKERLQTARADRARAERDLDHLQDRTALETLVARSGRAAAASEQLREATAAIAGISVDEDLLTELRAAQTDLARAEAALQAASPEVRFTAAQSVELEVAAQVTRLDAGATSQWPVPGTLKVRLGDVGELEVSAGAGIDDATQVQRSAEERLRDALDRGGVEDIGAAERAARKLHDDQRTIGQARRERDLALDGTTLHELDDEIDALRRRVEAYEQTRGGTPLPAGISDARAATEDMADRERRCEDAVAERQAEADAAREQLDSHRTTVVEHRARAEQSRLTLDRLQDELDEERSTNSDEALDGAVDDATITCDQARTELDKAQAALAVAEPDIVTTRADNAVAVAEDARKRLQDTERDLRDAHVRISTLGGDGLWEQREAADARLAHARARLAGIRRRAAAAQTLLQALERHRDESRERYSAPLKAQLLSYGRMLYGPDFDIDLDEDLRVARRHLDGVTLDVDQLSIGAQEQLALLGRLACGILLGDEGGLLLFDDALGNTDPERLERMGAVLRLAGEHCQVIVLTCYPERYHHVGGATRIAL